MRKSASNHYCKYCGGKGYHIDPCPIPPFYMNGAPNPYYKEITGDVWLIPTPHEQSSLARNLIERVLGCCSENKETGKYDFDYESLVLTFEPEDYQELRSFVDGV